MMVSKETLVVAKNQAGYFGVRLANPGYPKPYQARVKRSVAGTCNWAASPQ